MRARRSTAARPRGRLAVPAPLASPIGRGGAPGRPIARRAANCRRSRGGGIHQQSLPKLRGGYVNPRFTRVSTESAYSPRQKSQCSRAPRRFRHRGSIVNTQVPVCSSRRGRKHFPSGGMSSFSRPPDHAAGARSNARLFARSLACRCLGTSADLNLGAMPRTGRRAGEERASFSKRREILGWPITSQRSRSFG